MRLTRAHRLAAKLLGRRIPIAKLYPQYEIGTGTYGEPVVYDFGEGSTLRIGSYCSIAVGVTIFLGGEHRSDWVTTFPFNVLWDSAKGIEGHPKSKGDVVIGHDVWLAYESVIMSGVTIGTGAVVGAKSVVTRDVPPYAIVAGNPARLIRKRFSDDHIEGLLASRWWELEPAALEKLMPVLLSSRVDEFLQLTGSQPRREML